MWDYIKEGQGLGVCYNTYRKNHTKLLCGRARRTEREFTKWRSKKSNVSKVRIALCQFGIRDTHSFRDMENHLREQGEVGISKGVDLVLFPEYVTVGLLAMAGPDLAYNDFRGAMVDCLVAFSAAYETLFAELAQSNGVTTLGGSHWIMEGEEGRALNVAHIFSPVDE